jgi:flagellum-specific peptidoglycan hydrolase FlgJ|tara:strand:+ start:325 stop:909 length:585 start_codon:yes stop_codon:yes gene_type:complete
VNNIIFNEEYFFIIFMLYKVMKKIFVLIIIFTSSCSSLKTISDVENTVEQKINFYVKKYAPAATKNMRFFKIPASITLAQGILESGYGEGTLAKKANNHFGIKCHKEWKGKSITHDDDEKDECFRSYKNPLRSYRDHSLFLVDRDRYSSLFTLNRKDYKGWAVGLKAAGYATDPKYADKLISLIERFNLTRFDE